MNSAKQNEAQESPPSPTSHKFASIGKDCVIWSGAKIVWPDNIHLGNAVMIDDFTFLHIKKSLVIGDFVHIGAYSSIVGTEDCSIASFTSISWGTRIFTSTENLGGLFGPMIEPDLRGAIHIPVYIGRHVLIGANSVILPGATICDGVVIGAGSVVPKNQKIPPWTIWGGVPAHYIKNRPQTRVLLKQQELRRRYYGQV